MDCDVRVVELALQSCALSLQLATARAANAARPLADGIAARERDVLRAITKLALLMPTMTKAVSLAKLLVFNKCLQV